MKTQKKMDLNKSGISPCGNHVLVKPDAIEEFIGESKLIAMPDSAREKYQASVAYGVVIALGPDCFTHAVEEIKRVNGDGEMLLVEQKVTRYKEDFAAAGDRIAFAVHSGRQYPGEDGKDYVLMNDTDITARVTEKVKSTHLESRKPFSTE